MRPPAYRMPVASLADFVERLRAHRVTFIVRPSDWPCDFDCRIRRGFSSISVHAYRVRDELRFSVSGVSSLEAAFREALISCGGSPCGDDVFIDGLEEIAPKKISDTPKAKSI